ncbi:MAG: TonB family protein [Betaproteobacteria bacterium]|nr:TonB family protein [Betaproteobacteria bacterium]
MPAPRKHEVQFIRRHATSALTPALMFSLAVHAAAGGALFHYWHHAVVELPQPLTVTLEVLPPVVVESMPPVEIKPSAPAPKSRTLPVPQMHQAPAPAVMAVQRTDAAPAVVAAAVPEIPPAPVVVAKAPAVAAAPVRADAVEPPHFNVAYLNNPRPAYPPIARKLGLEGVVLLRVDVTAKGTPEKIVIAQTSGATLLDEAALKAVQGWTFVPARRGDTPIAHPVEVPIRFQLKN